MQAGGHIKDSIKPLVTKLNNLQSHTSEDIQLLRDAVCEKRFFCKDEDVIREGSQAKHIYLVLEGWVCRYKTDTCGKAQSLNIQISGDFCNLHTNLTQKIEYSIRTLVPSVIGYIPHDRIEVIYRQHERLTRSFNWLAWNEISILQEWLTNVGSRPAHQRLAHLLCELLIRVRAAGLTVDHRFHLPLTQSQLGEALGISNVHTNRVMTQLRAEGLVTFEDRVWVITDWQGLKEYADFDAGYLHLDNANPSLIQDL